MGGASSGVWGERLGPRSGRLGSTLPVPGPQTRRKHQDAADEANDARDQYASSRPFQLPGQRTPRVSSTPPLPGLPAQGSAHQGLTRVLAFRNTWLSISLLDLLWATPAFLMASSLQHKMRRGVDTRLQVCSCQGPGLWACTAGAPGWKGTVLQQISLESWSKRAGQSHNNEGKQPDPGLRGQGGQAQGATSNSTEPSAHQAAEKTAPSVWPGSPPSSGTKSNETLALVSSM